MLGQGQEAAMAAEMIGVVKEYLKMTQETLIPQFKEGLAEAIAANTLDKNTFTTTVTSFEQKLLQVTNHCCGLLSLLSTSVV